MGATQQFRTFSYELLSEFNDKACSISSIDLPSMQVTDTVNVSQAQDPAPVNYQAPNQQQIVTFTVTYIPFDTTEGRKLLPLVRKLVENVMSKEYKSAVAIIQLKRNDAISHETTINDCVITQGDIIITEGNNINITFTFQGLLQPSFSSIKKL